MTDHTVTAHETYIHETEYMLTEDGLVENLASKEKPPNWESLASYECSCGEEFDDMDDAIEHLYD